MLATTDRFRRNTRPVGSCSRGTTTALATGRGIGIRGQTVAWSVARPLDADHRQNHDRGGFPLFARGVSALCRPPLARKPDDGAHAPLPARVSRRVANDMPEAVWRFRGPHG